MRHDRVVVRRKAVVSAKVDRNNDIDDTDWDRLKFDLFVENGYQRPPKLCTCEAFFAGENKKPCLRSKLWSERDGNIPIYNSKCDKTNFFYPCYKPSDVKTPYEKAKATENIILTVTDDGEFVLDCLFPEGKDEDNCYHVSHFVSINEMDFMEPYHLVHWRSFGFNELTWEFKHDLNMHEDVFQQFKNAYYERIGKLQCVVNTIDKKDFPGYKYWYETGRSTQPGLYARIAELHYNAICEENGRETIMVENWTTQKAEWPMEVIMTNIFTEDANKALQDAAAKLTGKEDFHPQLINVVYNTPKDHPRYSMAFNMLFRTIGADKGRCCPCKVCDKECPCVFAFYKQANCRTKYPNHFTECHKSCPCKKDLIMDENKEKQQPPVGSQLDSEPFPTPPNGKKKMPPMFGCNVSVMLFHTNDAGWSVRTLEPIGPNVYVMEYVGHVMLAAEASKCKNDSYLFDCKPPHKVFLDKKERDNNEIAEIASPKYVIDASKAGDISRFINHSCQPNLFACTVQGYELDPMFQRVIFRSARAIKMGEELTFDYFEGPVQFKNIEMGTSECQCGAENCRKYLI